MCWDVVWKAEKCKLIGCCLAESAMVLLGCHVRTGVVCFASYSAMVLLWKAVGGVDVCVFTMAHVASQDALAWE